MRTLLVLVVAMAIAPVAWAKVWTTVYRCDETTPLAAVDANHPTIYRDIMAGTRLVIVVSSDTPGAYDGLRWSGGLRISWDDWQRGTLTGRGYNPQRRNYDGSCLAAAGQLRNSRVQYRERALGIGTGIGFDLGVDILSVAGDWFVLDYHAEQAGSCDVGLYDLAASVDVPLETLSFTHVPTRDFDGDTIVNFRDLALLASRCGTVVELDPNGPDTSFDLDGNGRIDLGDIASFSEYWLERTDCQGPATDPNKSMPSL